MIIVLPTEDESWQWFDITQPTAAHPGLPEQKTVTALLPTEKILLSTVELPKTRQPQKIISYAIEDQIIDAPEAVHIDFTQEKATNQYHFAVINKTLLQKYKTELEQSQITQTQAAIPDVLALTWQEGSWTIVFTSTRCLIRSGKHSGIAMDANTAEFVIKKLLQQSEDIPNFCNVNSCPQPIIDLLNKHTISTQNISEIFSEQQIADVDFNLIGKSKKKKSAKGARRGLLSTILISIAVLIFLGNDISNKIISNHIAQQYSQNIASISNRLGANIASRIQSDPVGTLQSALARLQHLRNNNKFINGLNLIGSAIGHVAHGDIEKLSYDKTSWQIKIAATKQEQPKLNQAFNNSSFKYQVVASDNASISYKLLETSK